MCAGMKAIVLTCDRYRALTDHMLLKYQRVWPNNPFRFRVAYQEVERIRHSHKVDLWKTSAPIKATVLKLLSDLPDEEFVYWCIDDKYPIELDLENIERIYQWIIQEGAGNPNVDGILFCRCRRMLKEDFLTPDTLNVIPGIPLRERSGYEQIWIHQFIRTKVLRYLFESFPDNIPFARLMDDLKARLNKPSHHRLFVTEANFAVFGESTSGGTLTRNCYQSLLSCSLPLPTWANDLIEKNIILGSLPSMSRDGQDFPTEVPRL